MDIKYKIESINESEYRFNYDFDYQPITSEQLSIKIGHKLKPLMDKDRIVVSAKVIITDRQTDTLLISNTVSVSFFLSPIKQILSVDSDGTISTKNTSVLDTFIITTIGALRGALMKNLKGTPLEFATIPFIPMESLRSTSQKS